ncbi:MAG: 4'-phosphopantetheinyl transferase superfamily protein [Lachnospiraceae bacterium]|nr:4'-phosphopantetheinyl transferase superfamily protein [Lachnospiraceae bacterium]
MDDIVKTYIISKKQFDEEYEYEKAVGSVSDYRRQKIDKLKNAEDKKRSLAASIALNAALKEYGLEECMMEYELGKQGKPYFRNHPEIHFSLSHSGNYAICSIGPCEVGNDIERVRIGREKVAQRFFAKEELDWIYGTEVPRAKDLQEAFNDCDDKIFRIWTMKESFLKVTGLGMSLPLNEFAIMVAENGCIHIRQDINDKTYHIKEYIMTDVLNEGEDYKISVCSETPVFAVQLIQVL